MRENRRGRKETIVEKSERKNEREKGGKEMIKRREKGEIKRKKRRCLTIMREGEGKKEITV